MALKVIDPIEEMINRGQQYINRNPEASLMQIKAFLRASLPERYHDKINDLSRTQNGCNITYVKGDQNNFSAAKQIVTEQKKD